MTDIKTETGESDEKTATPTDGAAAMTKLAEQSLAAFLEKEPDLYTPEDLRIAYRSARPGTYQ